MTMMARLEVALPIAAGALAVILAILAANCAADGVGGLDAALRATARLGFGAFIFAFVAGPLAGLGIYAGEFRRIARPAGLAFAAVLTVHVVVVVARCVSGCPPNLRTFVIFGGAAGMTYLMTACSAPAIRKVLPVRAWRWLSHGTLWIVAFAFAIDFFRKPPSATIEFAALYVPFDVLLLAAVALRIIVAAKRQWPASRYMSRAT